ncbi:MAG: BrnA antitoxin family protein [Deltaproteobacteria bacterium]|nr:BrnA antitoxin family protein [Deltaproteobacteria bacterium]
MSQAAAAARALRRPEENKRQVTMRFDSDVLDYFRRQGRGWQGRMNAVLRSFVESHQLRK